MNEYPARRPENNLTDILAQIAANNFGQKQLISLCNNYSLNVVLSYMTHILNNAEHHVRELLSKFTDGLYSFTDQMDDGSKIKVTTNIKDKKMCIDFTGND